MRLPRYADLPIRAKLLVPFVVLMIVWGGFGTLILSRASSREAQGYASSQLALAMDVARAAFAEEEAALLETVRTIARTVGVPDSFATRNVPGIQSQVELHARNSEHDIVRALDTKGNILVAVDTRTSPSTVTRGGVVRDQAALDAARGHGDALGDKWMGVSGEFLFAVGPVRHGAADKVVGAIMVSDAGGRVAARLTKGTDARVTLFTTAGVPFASSARPLPFRDAGTGLRASIDGGDEPFEALYAPLAARGAEVGTIAVGLPSRLALADVRGTATVLAMLVGFAVLCAVGIGVVTARAVTRPVGSLVHATRALERGDLGTRAAPHGRDEVGQLAVSFNRMAGQLEASHAELERKVEERTAELKRVNDELGRASAAKSLFLATMSHELRTPLNAVIGFADMLADPTFGRMSAKETRDLASKILTSGRHLLGLINDVLDLAKVEAGRVDVDPCPTDVGSVLKEVQSLISPLAAQRGIDLRVPRSLRVPKVMADPGRTRQILFNLMANAIKFTQAGGHVSVQALQGDGDVAIAVSDNGPGLSPEEIALVFHPFERAKNSRRAEGAGLGLALVRSFVELQGGRIWVESSPGKGSTFWFTLPLAEGASARPRSARKGAA